MSWDKMLKEFNERVSVGGEVIYTDDFGVEHKTRTRSKAWQLRSGEPVVLLERGAGGYFLERVKPAKVEGAQKVLNKVQINGSTSVSCCFDWVECVR